MICGRRLAYACFALSLAVSLTGCVSELKRKFIRQSKPKEMTPIYHYEEYPEKPYAERYREHYTFWRNWHMELGRPDLSHERNISNSREALRHMEEMQKCLVDEKAAELGKHIDDMKEICGRMERGSREDTVNNARLRRLVGNVERAIINNFAFNRMKDYIKPGP